MDLTDLILDWEAWARAARKSPATIRSYKDRWRRYLAWLKEQQLGTEVGVVRARHCLAYVEYLKEHYAEATAFGDVRHIKALYSWALANPDFLSEPMASNPWARVQPPKMEVVAPQHVTPEQVQALLGLCDTKTMIGRRDAALIKTMFDNGVRVSELLGMNVADLDALSRLITVHRKGYRSQQVPISLGTERSIAHYLRAREKAGIKHEALWLSEKGGRLTDNGLRQRLRKLGRSIEIPNLHPHMLRHTFAITALDNEASALAIQDILGHATLDMTKRYIGVVKAKSLSTQHAKFSPVGHLGKRKET